MKMIKLLFAGILLLTGFTALAEDGVARSVFTTGIDNREPVDQIGQLTNDNAVIYFFTEIRGMEGHTITHRWLKEGEVQAEVAFNVGANRWRVWSSKNLDASWIGNWQVMVVDEGGNTLAQESFAYIPAEESSAEQSTSSEESNESQEGEVDMEKPAAPASMTVQ
ncbi:MAG: DUF2914 domain-containing protein [Gammaproteobacteria bacterium]|nr:DUF2914 domain-containing protein [Gammaproteobacteria bacterium]MDH5735342.1 DUF2914 domain-containing protein [Gammaproteobacteria bacterium]